MPKQTPTKKKKKNTINSEQQFIASRKPARKYNKRNDKINNEIKFLVARY